MAIIGMFYQDGLTGSAWGDWSLYTDSPLRAFESELGVQAPLGFWDPAGFTSDGDADLFRRRRETELKHGRVSMIACIGYIVPEYCRFPGFLSPSAGLKFTDMPTGLSAVSKLPSAGLLQMFLFAGLVDFTYFRSDPSRAPGDYKNAGILGVPNGTGPMLDTEARKRKLSSEIANGRLAMMAIIGMFFQDGLTGSAWGDWALYTDSPLRAKGGADAALTAFDPSTQAGATEPLGFWDPCGFCKDKDKTTFLKYRGAELKHGRVAMLCIMGFLGQPSWRFPGFEQAPDGVGALTSAPSAAGFGCLFLLVGFFELRILADLEEGNEPGNFGDPLKMIS